MAHAAVAVGSEGGGAGGVIAPVIFELEKCESKLDKVATVGATVEATIAAIVAADVGKLVLELCVCV